MSLKNIFLKQFEKPSGNIGKLVGWVMSVSNKEMLGWMIEKMKISATDKVLEVGYGTGDAIHAIAGKLTTGFIEGVDHSEVMYRSATKKNAFYISNQKVRLHIGNIWSVQYRASFDVVCGSNVHFFWENPVEELTHLYSLLKTGGRIVLSFQPRWVKSEEEVSLLADILKEQYQMTGFKEIDIDYKLMKPVTCVYVSGKKI
ncbi:MAG: methyltransferase domain-containing protein [Chitinophagaceae bacterium]|nr:methyltransferase domain-containing protein [Chitinophagaceae bacterium]